VGTLLASAVGGFIMLNSGCVVAVAGAAAGAGTVAFVEGKFVARLADPYEQVVHAVERAIPQLQLALVEEKRDALAARFTARTAVDKKVEITVTRESDNLAKLEIRVGAFGDKQASVLIFEQIKTNL
jgi:hypothetical protein